MMQIYSHIETLPQTEKKGCAVAMGFFDGLHIGHQAVIGAAVNWAKKNNADSGVFTFHLPRINGLKGSRLLPTEEKHEIIEKMGVNYYVAPDFEEVKALTPEEFFSVLVDKLHVRALSCGENFTFGAKAAGNVEMLKELCQKQGVELIVVPLTQFTEKTVSSTRIRTALAGGDLPAVNDMLGRPYAIQFPVQHGAGLGRTFGCPTINQVFPEGYQLPKTGIYITKTLVNGKWYPSATGLGSRPTVNSDENKITCETFIPDFDGDLYGTNPRVEFYAYLAPSRRFESLDALKACIDDAAQQAKAYFLLNKA